MPGLKSKSERKITPNQSSKTRIIWQCLPLKSNFWESTLLQFNSMEFVCYDLAITSPHMVRSPGILFPKSLGQFKRTYQGSQSTGENLNLWEKCISRGKSRRKCITPPWTEYSGWGRRSSTRQSRWHSERTGQKKSPLRNSHRQSLCASLMGASAFKPPNHGSHMYRVIKHLPSFHVISPSLRETTY